MVEAVEEVEEEEEDEEDDDFSMKKVHTSKKIGPVVNASSVRQERQRMAKLPDEVAGKGPVSNGDRDMSSSMAIVPSSEPMYQKIPEKLDSDMFVDGNGKVLFYFIDHLEVGSTLLLFGKIKLKGSDTFVSCTVKVEGLCREVYFLPNEDAELQDVNEEIGSALETVLGVHNFLSKVETRKYCFELENIPREAEYIKVLLPFNHTIPVDFEKKLSTVSKIFAANSAMFEQFVLSRNIMGPGWLELSNGVFDKGSETNSKVNITIADPLDISPTDNTTSPPFTIMSLSIKTVMNHKENKQEVIAITCQIYHDISHDTTATVDTLRSKVITLVRPPSQIFPTGFKDLFLKRNKNVNNKNKSYRSFEKEAHLLTFFSSLFTVHDPDVILGHQLENIQLNVLIHRMKELKLNGWKNFGKYRRHALPNRLDFKQSRDLFAGRLICDISNEMGRSITMQCDTWSLTEMTSIILSKTREELDIDVSKYNRLNEPKGLIHILNESEQDSENVMSIALKVQILPLSKQLTNLAGNSWARTLTGARADRNEFILLHEFYRENYILPDKVYGFKSGKTKSTGDTNPSKKKYKGGLVFEPEKGLYKSIILVMDFNSLYPSIIQEFNICFTTVDRSKFNPDDDLPPPVPDSSESKGILPRLIETLVLRRREVKKLMKSSTATETERAQWDIKQQALKLTANSMYGCLGFESSRFYALPLAMMTTFKGREILSSTRELMEDNGLKVVYGDTDSVMINTNAIDFQQAMNIGNEVKKKVNERYQKLEIDIDNVFKRLLLLHKKKYAAINMSRLDNGEIKTSMEIKGLDLKRREYCQLSKDTSKYVLDQILEEDDEDALVNNIHQHLQDLGEKIRTNKIPITKFLINNKLGKDPKDYTQDKPPQVHVALRRIAEGEIIKTDDVITYLITKDDSNPKQTMGEKARTYKEVTQDKLQIDGEYYILHQIYPAIKRLCAHLDGTDDVRIAEYLGLDLKKHHISYDPSSSNLTDLQPLESTISDEERFKDSHRLNITCSSCTHNFDYLGLAVNSIPTIDSSGIICPSCKEPVPNFKINCQLEYTIRKEIADYYSGWLVCDDSSCGTETRQINVYGKKCTGQDGTCRGLMSYKYTNKMLYNQLLYFDSLFDVDKAKGKASTSTQKPTDASLLSKEQVIALAEQNRVRFTSTRTIVDKYLSNCGTRYVDMYGIFNFM